MDEDPKAWGRVKDRLIELIDATVNFRRVIITCRTQFFPNDEIDPFKRVGKIKVGSYVCPMFFLSLFDEEQVEEYLTKRFSSRDDFKKYIRQARNIILGMGSLRFRPLLLAHVDGFIEAGHVLWNEYLVYETLMSTWLMREERKLRRNGINIPQKDLFDACLNVAYVMHSTTEREISEPRLNELVQTFPKLSYLSHIDVGGRSLMNKNSDDKYRFWHYSIQEFLMAYGIKTKVFSNKASVRCTDKILAFLNSADALEEHLETLNFEGVNLSGMSFANIRMPAVSFHNANLSRADFSGAFLREVNMSSANLQGAKFDKANLTNADMTGVDATGASFVSSVMVGANLSASVFRLCDFTNATLVGVTRDQTSFDDAVFHKAFMR